jgi:hypothetical protein
MPETWLPARLPQEMFVPLQLPRKQKEQGKGFGQSGSYAQYETESIQGSPIEPCGHESYPQDDHFTIPIFVRTAPLAMF